MVSLRTGFADIDMSHNTIMSQYYACESMILSTVAQESLTFAMESETGDNTDAVAASEEKEKKGISAAVGNVMTSIKKLIDGGIEKLKNMGSSLINWIKSQGERIPMVGKEAWAAIKNYLGDCQKAIAKMISGKEDSAKILAAMKDRWASVKASAAAKKDGVKAKASDARAALKEGMGKIGSALNFLKGKLGSGAKAAYNMAGKGVSGGVHLVSAAFHSAMGVIRFMKDAVMFLFTGKRNATEDVKEPSGYSSDDSASDSWMSMFDADDEFDFANESSTEFNFEEDVFSETNDFDFDAMFA